MYYLNHITVYRPRGPIAVVGWRLSTNLNLNDRLVLLTKRVVLFVGTFPQTIILFNFVLYMALIRPKTGVYFFTHFILF